MIHIEIGILWNEPLDNENIYKFACKIEQLVRLGCNLRIILNNDKLVWYLEPDPTFSARLFVSFVRKLLQREGKLRGIIEHLETHIGVKNEERP